LALASDLLRTEFHFGSTTVAILQGDMLHPGVAIDAVVSTDDNYLTMSGGLSAALREAAGSDEYIREAQAQSPVPAGTVVVTEPYGLQEILGARYVLHGTVIDYDTDDRPLADLVEHTTAKCLRKAASLGVTSIALPPFATGAGQLDRETCAMRMCRAIKVYLATERPLKRIYIPLHLHGDENDEKNERFIRAANLVLGVPYSPELGVDQVRDFYGREQELVELMDIVAGKRDDGGAKRHAVILGGPGIGKKAVLDQLYYLAQQEGHPLCRSGCLVRVTFGRVHRNTPVSFVYRRFLSAMSAEAAVGEQDPALEAAFKEAYANPNLDCAGFLRFLQAHADRYPEVVFLIDRLPRLLAMDAEDADRPGGVVAFWQDLEQLQRYVRFVYTAREEEYAELYEKRLVPYASAFASRVHPVRVTCLSERAREKWIDGLFERYLDQACAPAPVRRFIEQEAGRQPYLISLLSCALVEAIKRDALSRDGEGARYESRTLEPFFQAARSAVAGPRQQLFDELMALLDPEQRAFLRLVARAISSRSEQRTLLAESTHDPDAQRRLSESFEQGIPLAFLDRERLRQLENLGYLIDTGDLAKADFMAASFGTYVTAYFGLGRPSAGQGKPHEVEITLLNPEPRVIRTLFRGSGARIVTATKELRQEDRRAFMENLRQCIDHLLHPVRFPESGPLRDLDQVGNAILTQFTTGAIKTYLYEPPRGSTIVFEIDEALKGMPWELMLETAYTGEIPFRVGRTVIGQQAQRIRPPVRGGGRKVKALLIGDPCDDLAAAADEVRALADRLEGDGRFAPVTFIGGEECEREHLLAELGCGEYGLIHYSGHSSYDGYHSAWLLKGGESITTDVLTSVLQVQPPVLVLSSSCESATADEPQPIVYENQTFDLPSAFLQAGVEAYIGSLWAVDSLAAGHFVDVFYTAFLSGDDDLNLGECMRRAKWALKRYGDHINWPAFVLYGDPHLRTGDLYPVLGRKERSG
jgi:O-acetyl-ADP-ribose deacetylase (regulator of RNase III)